MREPLKWEDLKAGDVVATYQHVNIGWKSFRYGLYTKRTIRRITPKRRYIVMEDGTEWKQSEAVFYAPSPEQERENGITKAALELSRNIDELDRNQNWIHLQDDEIIKLHDAVKSALESITKNNTKEFWK